MSREQQKFLAFMGLVLAVLLLALLAAFMSALEKGGQVTDPTVLNAKLTILNMAMGGLIGAVGAASQAFFRHSQVDADNASAAKSMAENLPTPPKEVTVVNPPSNPANVTETPAPDQAAEVPPMFREESQP